MHRVSTSLKVETPHVPPLPDTCWRRRTLSVGMSAKEAVWPCAVARNQQAMAMFKLLGRFRIRKLNHIT